MLKFLLPLIRPLLMTGAFAVGFFFPVHGAGFLIRYFLMLMLFFVFLRLRLDQFHISRSHYVLVLLNFLLGIVPFLILKQAGMPEFAAGMFFVGITPTATAAPVIMSFLGGRVSYVITAFLMTNISISAAMPFLIYYLHGGTMSAGEFLKMTGNIAALILVPLTLAWVIRKLIRNSEKIARKSGNISFALWVTVLYIISSDASIYLHAHTAEAAGKAVAMMAGGSMILCILNFVAGRLAGEANHRREASQSLGQKNTTFTIYLASAYGNPLIALGPTFYVLWHNTWNAWQMYHYSKEKQKQHSRIKSETSS